jgi:hypothetical protein
MVQAADDARLQCAGSMHEAPPGDADAADTIES